MLKPCLAHCTAGRIHCSCGNNVAASLPRRLCSTLRPVERCSKALSFPFRWNGFTFSWRAPSRGKVCFFCPWREHWAAGCGASQAWCLWRLLKWRMRGIRSHSSGQQHLSHPQPSAKNCGNYVGRTQLEVFMNCYLFINNSWLHSSEFYRKNGHPNYFWTR